LFGTLSPEQLEQQVAPGKNRLIYLWGHLTAVNDGLLPLLGIGERLHPELDTMFISKPDRSVELTVTGQSLKSAWEKNQPEALGRGLRNSRRRIGRGDTPPFRRKSSKREPNRNKFTVLLGRTAHMSYHVGQAMLARPKA